MGSSFSEIFGRNKKLFDSALYNTARNPLFREYYLQNHFSLSAGAYYNVFNSGKKKNAENLMILPYKNTFVKKKININM